MKPSLIFSAIMLVLPPALNAAGFEYHHEWTFHHTVANGSHAMGSEILSFDPINNHLWVIGTDANEADEGKGGIDILDLSGNLLQSIDTSALGGINSIDIHNHQAAVAITAPQKTDSGLVRFFDTKTYAPLVDVTVGANPDAVKFTHTGKYLLVANEGEPSSYLIENGDPEGSISIIDSNTYQSKTADFGKFNGMAATLKSKGVRLTGPNATVAQDLEPEYIAISHNDKQAFVTLQEANSIAIVDIASATVTDITPLGLKDHSLPGNGLDISDRDGPLNNPLLGNIQNWAVKGMYMPDGITSFTQKGKQYFFTANEGDSRGDWPGGNDEIQVVNASIDPHLNALLTARYGADWQSNNDKFSRLTVSTSGDLDKDGDLDELQAFGARSFSILDATGSIIFDSGDQLEQILKSDYPEIWDDRRSDNKGPEPESIITGRVNGRDLMFIGLERSNAIMVWDISDLKRIEFLDMIFTKGDVGPEGLSFFSNGNNHYLAVANEVSETTSLYRIATVPVAGGCGNGIKFPANNCRKSMPL